MLTKLWSGNLKEEFHLEDLGIYWRIISRFEEYHLLGYDAV
jgi:hypothetical protein